MDSQPDPQPPRADHSATFAGPPPSQMLRPAATNYKKSMIIIAAIVLLALAGGAAYWLISHRQPAKIPQPATSTQTQPTVTPDVAATSTMQQFVSNGKDLNLTFTYPSNWTVSPTSNNNANDGPITVASPLISTTSASNTAVTGKVIISIRPGSSDLPEFASGNATVAQGSVQFAYSKPTSTQHQYPYLTFIHLAGGSNPGGAFEEIMITGITSFAKDQGVTSGSFGQLDPIISAAFYACTTQACTGSGQTPLSITNSTWLNDDTFKQVLALFESLQLN